MLKRLSSKLISWFGFGRTIGLLGLFLLLAIRVIDPTPLEAMRLKVFDFYQQFNPRISKALPIVIVDIDDDSLKEFGQWPWPRTLIAQLVTNIAKTRSVAMAFDIVFSEPDRLSPSLIANSLKGLDETLRTKLRNLPNNEQVLALAMRRARVILGQSGSNEKSALAKGSKPPQTAIAVLGTKPDPYLISYPGLLRNLPILEKNAKGQGLFTIAPDFDGLIRRVPLIMKAQGRILPGLSTELLRVATGSNALLIKSNEAGIRSLVVGGVEVPTDNRGRLWLYYARHDPKRYISAADILNNTAKARQLAGKLVFIGTSAIGLKDLKATPMGPSMPGVEIHAQVLENILTRSFLKRPNYIIGAEFFLAILTAMSIIWFAPNASAIRVFLLGGTAVTVVGGLSWYLFISQGILLDIVFPLLSTFVIFLTVMSINYLREETQRRQIRSAFGQYLSPTLVEQLAESPDKLVLGGETRVMSILFSDVRGFTAISELYKDDPQGLTSLMNDFLTPISNAIIDHRGTIDKYMGDAVMAFWNAPLDDAEHAKNACESALEMLVLLKELNTRRQQQAKESGIKFIPIEVGIGINTAQCAVGNMGSDVHFNYSVMGDGVNLASRLEGQTKTYGVPIIIGSHTADMLGDDLATLEIDNIRVKGKQEPEVIYTVLGGRDVSEHKRFKVLKNNVRDTLAHYRAGKWTAALKQLKECRVDAKQFTLDGYLDLLEARIKTFRKNPPPKNWGGVFVHETK